MKKTPVLEDDSVLENGYLQTKLEEVVRAILDGTLLEEAMNILEEEEPSVNNASPLLQNIFEKLKSAEDQTTLRSACRSILNKISLAQGGYEFESMFENTKVIFEDRAQQNAFIALRINLTSIETNKKNRLTGLSTDLNFNEEFVGYLIVLFPHLEAKLQKDLEDGIIQIQIENSKISMRYKGQPSH